MAVPLDLTLPNLNGRYTMNKQLSDPADPLLALQGVSWFLRTTISLATITVKLRKYTKDGADFLEIISFISPMPESVETRHLDFELRSRTDKVFGKLKYRSRITTVDELEPVAGEASGGKTTAEDVEHLKAGDRKAGDASVIQGYAESDGGNGWYAEQIWAIEEVEGERRLTQRAVARKGKEVLRIRVVYDYLGTIE